MSYDPQVYTTVTATMAALQRHVSRGTHWYVMGTVNADRALALAGRFDERYGLSKTVAQRDHVRRQGRATFRFLLWSLADQIALRWWLLRTDGDHPLLTLERWRDARQDRVRWPWLFELVRLPVDRVLRSKYLRPNGQNAINPVTWTWRIRRDEIDAMRSSIRHWSQYDDDRLATLIRGLQAAPGFRGVRRDVHALYRYIVRQHERRKRDPPSIPQTIRWVTPRRARRVPLSVLVRRQQQGRATWFPARWISADTVPALPMEENDHAAEATPDPGRSTTDPSAPR
jgi:hypothetical protein